MTTTSKTNHRSCISHVLRSVCTHKSYVANYANSVSLTEIIEHSKSRRSNLPETVAIAVTDPLQLLSYLVCFDGYVQTIVLISPESSTAEINRRLKYFGNCSLLTDNNALPMPAQQSASEGVNLSVTPRYETTWVVATSGTTSTPRQVAHTFRSLTRTTKIGHGSEHIWGVLYDPYRYAGLQVLLQALLGGSSVVFPNRHDSMQNQLAFLAENNVSALSGTPTQWRMILMSDKSNALDLRTVSLGGEIVRDEILHALANAYPHARIRHIYASTEAGTGFSVDDNRAGFPASFLTDPPAGIELKIHNQTLHIKNPGVRSGYVEDSGVLKDSDTDHFIDTGDMVVVEGDRVHFQGRLSGVINVGGNKVFPEHVEKTLLTVPNVSLVRVYGQPNPIVGHLVVADIVVANKTDLDQTKLRLAQIAKQELQEFESPVHYKFVDHIELTNNGKVIRS